LHDAAGVRTPVDIVAEVDQDWSLDRVLPEVGGNLGMELGKASGKSVDVTDRVDTVAW